MTTKPETGLFHFTTEGFRPADRVTAWHEVYGRTVAKIELEAPPVDTDFMISATLRSLPGLGISETASTETHFHKTRQLIDNDDVVLTILDSGYASGAQLGREARIGAGEAILSANSEVGSGISFGRRVLLRIPQQALAPSVVDLGGKLLRCIPRETEGLRLLRQYLHGMQGLDLATPGLQRLAVTHVHDLVALTLGATHDATHVAEERGASAARLRAVKDYIARNLMEGDVSASVVAARQRVSPRYLRKLFESEGITFSEYVLDQRLALAHKLLSDPRRMHEKIASVALEAGFGDVSYFYRAFRRRFDALPTDVREQAQNAR